jgi:hypothetical protein
MPRVLTSAAQSSRGELRGSVPSETLYSFPDQEGLITCSMHAPPDVFPHTTTGGASYASFARRNY